MVKISRVSRDSILSGSFFSRSIRLVETLLESPPKPWMRKLNNDVTQRLGPVMNKGRLWITKPSDFLAVRGLKQQMSSIRYKGVTGLVGVNILAYMILNSRSMKTRSRADGLPLADRHFIASRYNLSHGRIWALPLSIFNHGDSLLQLGMNCFGLALVGPAVELALGTTVLVASFMCSGMLAALSELLFGNHWCRGSSGGVTGLFALGAFLAPTQIVSFWGVMNVRAGSLAISIFGFEMLAGLFASRNSEIAHIAHATGIASAIPILYYLKWFHR